MKYKLNPDKKRVEGIPEMKEPEYFGSDTAIEKMDYLVEKRKYNEHIKSLPSYEIIGSIPEDWPEVLEEGVHFEIENKWHHDSNSALPVAIPIIQSKEPDISKIHANPKHNK